MSEKHYEVEYWHGGGWMTMKAYSGAIHEYKDIVAARIKAVSSRVTCRIVEVKRKVVEELEK